MKLLSMRAGGEDRSGMLIGPEVLDARAFRDLEERGKIVIGSQRSFVSSIAALADALDLLAFGVGELLDLAARISGDAALAETCREGGALKPLDQVALNPPVLSPGKILAVGLNYAAHAAEQNKRPPSSPLIFSKCVTALIGPEDPIILPEVSEKPDYEAELAVIIGKEAKNVKADYALDYVAGYTIMNDVTARDLQQSESQWARAKGLDTFAPCGPWLVTTEEISDPHALDIQLRVNGELRQDSNTSDLIFDIPRLIEFISQDLTLKPGDIISTGTPAGVGVHSRPPVFLRDGDQIEIFIDGIGTLRSAVRGRSAALRA
ncbi:MAG TPA: fumarylacetoacetate hydrolase family protein [Blastocatellia bacterium]|nr:fumarylacetoacetate hydrolase family protein [Blastocatellia bacterium]